MFRLVIIYILIFQFSNVLKAQYSSFTYGGLNREYIYYEPPGLAANSPLIVVLHGYTDDASAIRFYSGMDLIADAYGFAVCYPRGTVDYLGERFFNVGYDFHLGVETVDDLGFVEALARYLQLTHNLDSNRVYATGLSNGGDLCYKIACHGNGVFKAVAPVSGMILQDIIDSNNNYNPIPILEIHGTQDNVTFFNGDSANIGGWGAYPSIPSTMLYFANLNNCTVQISDTLPNFDTTDNSIIIREKYIQPGTNCNQVWLYKVEGGGHDWIGSWGNMDVYAGVEMVEFFQEVFCTTASSVTNLNKNDIKIYPNPIVDYLHIETGFNEFQYTFSIFDISGKIIESGLVDKINYEITTKNLNPGFYFLKVGDKIFKIVKL